MNEEIEKAMKELSEWLEYPTELGKKPYKIEYTNSFNYDPDCTCHIFKFKKSLLSDWMLGIVSDSGIFSEMKKYNQETEFEDAVELVNFLIKCWTEQMNQMVEEQNN